jgi:hypothetical protein
MRLEVDIRYVVTSLEGTAQHLYEDVYCQRGQMENLIKLHKAQLAVRPQGSNFWSGIYPPNSGFRFFRLPPPRASASRICSMALVRRRMASARDGESSCLRRHMSTLSRNSSDTRI